MNTKTEPISSGLVAVAWIAPDGDRFRVRICEERPTDAPLWSPMCWISDAEAKLAECVASYEKEVFGLVEELEAQDAFIADLQNLVVAENQRKQQLEAEVALMKVERGESQYCAGCNEAQKTIEKQSAALKLAKERGFCE